MQIGSVIAASAPIIDGAALASRKAQPSPATTARWSGLNCSCACLELKVADIKVSCFNQYFVDPLFLALIECLAQRSEALLLRRPVAAAGDGAVDHQIVAIDEAGFVTGEKPRGVRDILGQSGARDRLRGLVDLPHHVGRFLCGFNREP